MLMPEIISFPGESESACAGLSLCQVSLQLIEPKEKLRVKNPRNRSLCIPFLFFGSVIAFSARLASRSRAHQLTPC
jgi:hypothetical protein